MRSANADALSAAATVSGAQITGTLGTAQIADNAVSLTKLSPSSGAYALIAQEVEPMMQQLKARAERKL